MKHYFPILLLFVIAFSGCISLPGDTGGPECYTDEDCSDYGDNYICGANGDCDACPVPECTAPPFGCRYVEDDSARCPTCGTLECTPTEPAPTCTDGKKNGQETGVDCGGSSCPACASSTNVVISDSLQGSTKGEQVGGTFTSEGYNPGRGFNHIHYEVPKQIWNGYVEVEVKGFNFNDFPAGESNSNSFYVFYDGRGINEPIPYWTDYRNNYFRWETVYRSVKPTCAKCGNRFKGKILIASPETSETLGNNQKAVFANDAENHALADWINEPNGITKSWDPNKWYTIRTSWNNDKKEYKIFRDGEEVWNMQKEYGLDWSGESDGHSSTPHIPWYPKDFNIWLGAGPGDHYSNEMPNLVFRNFKVVEQAKCSGANCNIQIPNEDNPLSFFTKEPFRNSFFVTDANNDGKMDYTLRTETELFVYDSSGNLMWSKNIIHPQKQVIVEQEDGNHWRPGLGSTYGAGDIDGDGKKEIVALNEKNQILIIDGQSGTTEKTIQLPQTGEKNRFTYMAVVNLRGNGDQDLIAQTHDTAFTNSDKMPLYINRNLLAWDLKNNKKLWSVYQDREKENGYYEGYWGPAHGSFRAADVDNDGKDEVIGGNMIDHDGTVIDLGYPQDWIGTRGGGYTDHLDAVILGDFRPDLPGIEWVVTEEDHVGQTYYNTAMLSKDGIVWRKETSLFRGDGTYDREPQNVAGGNFDTSKPHDEIWVRSTFWRTWSDEPQHPWVFDAYGNQFADYKQTDVLPKGFNTHERGNKEGLEIIYSIDWTGGEKEYLAAKARHIDGNFGVFDAITGLPIYYSPKDTPETQASIIYVADAFGDSREEIIIYDKKDNKIKVYFNEDNSFNPNKPSKWNEQDYKRQKQNWNYYSP